MNHDADTPEPNLPPYDALEVVKLAGVVFLSPRIADSTGIPPKYVSTILRELARRHVPDSTRGKAGGFQLARPDDQFLLHDAFRPFEQILPI